MLLHFKWRKSNMLLTLLLIFCVSGIYGQTSLTDSLLATLPTQKDTHYIVELQRIIPDLGDLEIKKKYAQISLDLSESLNFLPGRAEGLYSLAEYQRIENKYQAAFETFEKASAVAMQIYDTELVFDSYRKSAFCLREMGKTEEAYQYLDRARELAKVQEDDRLLAKAYFALGDYFRLQEKVEKAIDYFEKSQALHDPNDLDQHYCRTTFYIAMTRKLSDSKAEQRKGVKALESMTSGYCWDSQSPYNQAVLLNNIGSAYTFLGELDKAQSYLDTALVKKRAIGDSLSIAYTLNELASLFLFKSQPAESIRFALEGYELAKDRNNIYVLEDLSKNLAEAYYDIGDYKAGYQFLEEHYTLEDSIRGQETNETIASLDAKYENQQKEKAIIEKDLVIARQESRLNQYLFAGLALLSLITGAFFWYRSRLQQQRLEAQKLQELDELKSNFFTNITHEFRTPLTVMLNSLPEVNQDDTSYFMNKESVVMLRRNADRLHDLINQLLELSKLEAGKMQLQLTGNNLGSYLKTLVANFQSLAASKNISLNFISHLSEEKYYFDVDKLEKILSNLINNAIKFTPEAGEVNVWTQQVDEQIEIYIRDNGIGIPKEQLLYIFDRFQQVDDSTTRSYEGTGVGLALVKELVKVHKGSITVESAKGEGTVFKVVLPANKNAYPDALFTEMPFVKMEDTKRPLFKTKETVAMVEDTTPNKNPLVLIVEDDPDLRYLLHQQLKEHYQILEAENGQKGIDLAFDRIPDLIVSDVMMPELSGYELCETLKKDVRTNHIPIILLTAKATQKEKNEGLGTGADNYLTKPFDPTELRLRIQNQLQQRQVWQQRFAGATIYRTTETPVQSRQDKFIQDLLRIIEEELSNDRFGVEQLASAVHMSRSQLYRKVKAMTDKTPNFLLREIRLQKAKQLLEQEAGNVSEIANMVGFSNTNYFYKSFKEYFGTTPGELLRKV